VSCVVLLVFAMIPGFPAIYFIMLALGLFGCTILVKRRSKNKANGASGPGADASGENGTAGGAAMTPGATPLMIRLSPDLMRSGKFAPKVEAFRHNKFEKLGIPLPDVQLFQDASLSAGSMQIMLYQEAVMVVDIPDGLLLADVSTQTLPQAEKSVRLPFSLQSLQWVSPTHKEALSMLGVTLHESEDRLVHCLSILVDRYAGEFIGVQETRFLMDAMEGKYSDLIKEVQRQLPIGRIADVLQRLVTEGVSIRDLRSIFEALIEWAPREKDPIMLVEYVRIGLRRHLVTRFKAGNPWISCWMIGDVIESMIREAIRQTSSGSYSALDSELNQAIIDRIREQTGEEERRTHVLMTAIDIRRFLRKVIEREFYNLQVLSFQEIGEETELHVVGNIDLIGEE
jgi:type III secretion protein V